MMFAKRFTRATVSANVIVLICKGEFCRYYLWALCLIFVGIQVQGCQRFFGPKLKWTLTANGLPRDGIWKSNPVFADVRGDGFLDLAAIPRLGNGPHVWLDGKGVWRDSSQGLAAPMSCGGGVAFADFNRDRHLDLAAADHCSGVSVFLGDGQGRWMMTTRALNPAALQGRSSDEHDGNEVLGAEDIAVGDVNEDGYPDLVVTSRMEGGITVYFGNGSGKSWKESSGDGLPKSGWANRILLQDINGDGHLDVIASYYEGPRVWRGDGKGHWHDYSRGLPVSSAGGLYRGLAVGDVNEDGRLDIAVANIVAGPLIYLQTADGGWESGPTVRSYIRGGATALALGDLDGDKHLDLVVGGSQEVNNQYGLFVFRGNGKAQWSELRTNLPLKELSFVWGVALADVNGDGLPDLAVSTGESVKVGNNDVFPRMQVWINRYRRRS